MRNRNRQPASAARVALTALVGLTLSAVASLRAADAADGFLGVQIADEDRARVAAVMPGSPADRAGLRAGDVLLGADGYALSNGTDAPAQLRGPAGSAVKLLVERDGKSFEATLTRAARPDSAGPVPSQTVDVPPIAPPRPLDIAPPPPAAGHAVNPLAPPSNPLAPAVAAPANPLAAGDAAVPAFVRAGTRLLFREGQSVVQGVSSFLTPGFEPNTWNYKEAQNSGGAGFFSLDVLAAAPDAIAAQGRYYLTTDVERDLSISNGAVAVRGNADALEPYWMNPAKLARLAQVGDGGAQVSRVRYALDGRDYDAISILQASDQSYCSKIYDSQTGVLLALSQSQQNAPVAAVAGGLAPGARVLEHVRFAGRREVRVPWAAERPPRWAAAGTTLNYQGSYGTAVMAGAPPLSYPLTYAVRFDEPAGEAFLVTTTTRRDIGNGLPAQESTARQAVGSGGLGGLWVAPAAVSRLRPGEVIDEDPLLKFRTAFVGAQGNVAVFEEQGPLERTRFAYDLQTGMLVGVDSTVRNPVGEQTTSYRIVR